MDERERLDSEAPGARKRPLDLIPRVTGAIK